MEEHSFSMPVGRIEYLHLGPMTFSEFLCAASKNGAAEFLEQFNFQKEFSLPMHTLLIDLLKQYLVIGGMPESIKTFLETGSYIETDRIKQSILVTYRDDFSKYGKRVNHTLLETVFNTLPLLPGSTVKFSRISRDYRPEQVSQTLHLLSLARVCSLVFHSSCEGIPLAATLNRKKLKVVFLDVGLQTAACGLTMLAIENAGDILFVNQGSITEQFVGQHLLYQQIPYREPELHFWSREKSSSNAEIDYVIATGTKVTGIEVKSGTSGSLKSLNQFSIEKQYPTAVRFNLDLPSFGRSTGRMPAGEHYDFNLLSLPCYLVEQVDRILAEVGSG